VLLLPHHTLWNIKGLTHFHGVGKQARGSPGGRENYAYAHTNLKKRRNPNNATYRRRPPMGEAFGGRHVRRRPLNSQENQAQWHSYLQMDQHSKAGRGDEIRRQEIDPLPSRRKHPPEWIGAPRRRAGEDCGKNVANPSKPSAAACCYVDHLGRMWGGDVGKNR